MGRWFRIFKFPSVVRGPKIGWSVSLSISSIRSSAARWGGVISADIKHWMNESYAYTTVRKVYNIL